MRKVQTTFTCDRCGTTETESGDKPYPPMRWCISTLEIIDECNFAERKNVLLCFGCRASLRSWLEVGAA